MADALSSTTWRSDTSMDSAIRSAVGDPVDAKHKATTRPRVDGIRRLPGLGVLAMSFDALVEAHRHPNRILIVKPICGYSEASFEC